jgi:hypothetical protein
MQQGHIMLKSILLQSLQNSSQALPYENVRQAFIDVLGKGKFASILQSHENPEGLGGRGHAAHIFNAHFQGIHPKTIHIHERIELPLEDLAPADSNPAIIESLFHCLDINGLALVMPEEALSNLLEDVKSSFRRSSQPDRQTPSAVSLEKCKNLDLMQNILTCMEMLSIIEYQKDNRQILYDHGFSLHKSHAGRIRNTSTSYEAAYKSIGLNYNDVRRLSCLYDLTEPPHAQSYGYQLGKETYFIPPDIDRVVRSETTQDRNNIHQSLANIHLFYEKTVWNFQSMAVMQQMMADGRI